MALDVLRAWGVKGDDAALARAIKPLDIGGDYHALWVAVLGSYLGNFAKGDPNRAPEFSLQDAEESDDPKARKLHRILEQYARALTPAERDLLARLSLFPRGVKVELLGWIVQSGGEVAGALVGLADRDLVRLLERLRALGLVFRYETERQMVYSAHPFLREFFRNLLGTKPESVHESVRSRLAPSLEARPSNPPRDAAILDQYELLIEQTLLAGHVQEAFDLYWFGLGNYNNVGRTLGENVRGLRILERFVPRDQLHLTSPARATLVNALGVFAMNLGDLPRARGAILHARALRRDSSAPSNESTVARNLAVLEVHAGRFPEALEHAESAILPGAVENKTNRASLAYRAAAHFALGDTTLAIRDFQQATDRRHAPLIGLPGIWEAESRVARGDWFGARSQTEANRKIVQTVDLNTYLCRCNALLAQMLLREDSTEAAHRLREARDFADRSGHVELRLRCFQAACELRRHLGDYPQSISEGEAGILLADTCGYGKYSIDLRLSLAETYLVAGDPRQALQNARSALDRSEQPDCQYAWGKADGLHFCGMAHLRLGERELARQRLTAALELRERLGHGRIEETRRAMESLTA